MVSKPSITSVIINTAGQLNVSIEAAPNNNPKKNIKHTITIKAIINSPNRSIFYIDIHLYITKDPRIFSETWIF